MSRPHLLIADAEPDSLHLLQDLFQESHHVITATTGREALELAGSARPDVILLDVVLPDLDGYTVCQMLKKNPFTRDISVIFVTTRNAAEDERRGFIVGAADYITKPFNADVVSMRVQNQQRLRQAMRELADRSLHLKSLVDHRTEALAIAKDAAETANRAKTVFLTNMSHELRTPMNGVIGMVSLALRLANDEKQRHQLEQAIQSARHLMRLIEDILDISKIESEQLTLECVGFRLQGIMDNLRNTFEPLATTKGLGLFIDAEPSLLSMPLRGDPMRLSQIFSNLIDNAIKFSHTGKVTVSLSALEQENDVVSVHCTICDMGIGIPAAHIGRIFAIFEQGNASPTRTYKGTGLGLGLCKRLVERMGGAIGVNSTAGVGSCFWFDITFDRATALPQEIPTEQPQDLVTKLRQTHAGQSILVAEDNPVHQEFIREFIENAGLSAEIAEDGITAVARANHQHYDLVLMDVLMPGLDGIEATRHLRALPGCQKLPIIAITATAFAEDRERCLAAGMNDHLPKPIQPAQLYALLLKWLPPKN